MYYTTTTIMFPCGKCAGGITGKALERDIGIHLFVCSALTILWCAISEFKNVWKGVDLTS